jgi:uncharacterized protein
MQRMLDAGVRFGCITVLHRFTAPRVEAIFEFFYELGISFRLLPIYRTGFEHQQDSLGLTDAEIVEAFKKVTDLWFEMKGFLQVRPIEDYVSNVLRRYAGPHLRNDFYNKRNGEVLFIVDTDGAVYSNADAYGSEYCYGNIFENSLGDLLGGHGYERAITASEERMHLTCSKCNFHGACSGFFMGEATPEQRYLDDQGQLKCGIALPLHRYIEQKLAAHGILDVATNSLDRSKLPMVEWKERDGEAIEF